MPDPGTLATLNWLVEAGADETTGEEPVNRLIAKAAVTLVPAGPEVSVLPPRPASRLESTDSIGSAMALAAACNSLVDLKSALEAFEGCALKRGAIHTVFADGIPGAVMFIGEAPGADEDRIGLPFVGRAGRLLDRMLQSIALARKANAYITNVINWRPPNNRDPTPEEAATCLPFLRRHIELAEPKLIVLLGAVAVRHVMGLKDGIMNLRGHWLDYRVDAHMVPVLPTVHPAYLLRQPAHKKLAWRDLQLLRDRMAELGL